MMSVFVFIVQFVGSNHLLCPFLVVRCVRRLRKRQEKSDSGQVAGPQARIGNITRTRGRRSEPSAFSSLFTRQHPPLQERSPARLLAPKGRGRGGSASFVMGKIQNRYTLLAQLSLQATVHWQTRQSSAWEPNSQNRWTVEKVNKHDKKWKWHQLAHNELNRQQIHHLSDPTSAYTNTIIIYKKEAQQLEQKTYQWLLPRRLCIAIYQSYAMGRNYNELASIGPFLWGMCTEHAHIRARRSFGSGSCPQRKHHSSAIILLYVQFGTCICEQRRRPVPCNRSHHNDRSS